MKTVNLLYNLNLLTELVELTSEFQEGDLLSFYWCIYKDIP